MDQSTNNSRELPYYKIVHSLTQRYDGWVSYYVFSKSVTPSKSYDFIENAKAIIDDIAKRNNTRKFSLEIYDDLASLEIGYNAYGLVAYIWPMSDEQKKLYSEHFVIAFTWELETNPWNILNVYIAIGREHETLGKYNQWFEYTPNME